MTTSADIRIATEGYSNLMEKRYDSYRLLSLGREYVEVLQESVERSVSINHAKPVTL